MNIERKSHGSDDEEAFYLEPEVAHPLPAHVSRGRIRRIIPFVITAILVAALTFGVVKYTTPEHFGLQFALKATNGKIALSEKQLKDLVVGEGLIVYWLGPEIGARYALISVNANQNYVRYLPAGEGLNDVGANFRVVGTYKTKDAFLTTQNSVLLINGSSGFTNADGDAVSYNTITHPLSAYVGMKDTDYQIEIFDPIAGQAVIAARTLGLIQKIG